MSSWQATSQPERPPELDLLARALDGEVPLGAALAALVRRPECARLWHDFTASLVARRGPPDDPAPWVAACFGLADLRECARRAYFLAERFLARLRSWPAERRAGIVCKARIEATNPALLDLFVAEARAVQGADPEAALGWLDLAPVVAAHLAGAGFPRLPLDAAHVRVAAHRANAVRLAGDLPAADRLFRDLADDRRRQALAHPAGQAELLSLEASLRIDRREFATAERHLAAAERLYRSVGDMVGAAKALIQRGSAAEYAGDCERAVEIRQRAAELLDAKTEPVLYLMCQMNLANTLVSLARPAEAAAIIAAHRELLDRYDDATDRVRRIWVEARIARAEERFDEADRLLGEVRNRWLSLGRPYEAALATLGGAELHFARGDWRAVQRRAELLIPIFEANGVHREARAALILFQQAARAETLTADFLARLRRYLTLARNDRTFRFDPHTH